MNKSKALVFVNIGTPEEATVGSVRRYLKRFLMDPYVIDLPVVLRWILVHLIIAPFRAKKSLEAYKSIWQEEGSPLEVYTKKLVATSSQREDLKDFKVDYAMSYSKPFVHEKLDELKSQGFKEVFYLPMYPQYAESSSRTAIESAKAWQKKNNNKDVAIKTKTHFFHENSFLETSTEKIKKQIESLDSDFHFLFSYHGLPLRHVQKIHPKSCQNCQKCCELYSESNRFCYRSQCIQTTESLAKRLDLKNYSSSFQSRLGREQWLLPYTVEHVKELAKSGVRKLAVLPYAFTIDCLETEEEIEEEIKESFLEAGGEDFKRIECLNQDFSKVLNLSFLKTFTSIDQIKFY